MIRSPVITSLCALLGLAACDDSVTAPSFRLVDRAALITSPYLNGRLQMQAKVIHDPTRPFAIGLDLTINGDRAVDQTKRIYLGSQIIFDGVWQGRAVQVEMTRDIQFIRTFYELDIYIEGNLVETIEV